VADLNLTSGVHVICAQQVDERVIYDQTADVQIRSFGKQSADNGYVLQQVIVDAERLYGGWLVARIIVVFSLANFP